MADMLKAFADDLKAVREEKNISLRSISQQTRLSLTLLESLENGDFTFQPQAYIRAFLKQYINSIGLDADETLFEYDLAKSGKYKPKRINPGNVSQSNEREDTGKKSSKQKITEKIKEIVAEPKNPPEAPPVEDKTESRIPVKEEQGSEPVAVKKETREMSTEPGPVTVKKEEKNYNYTQAKPEKKGINLSFLNSPVARNISLILFIALVLLGLYSLINILFLDGSKDKPEVIRQNFDDVVKEQEKKILGKRTPEEIQDSIRKAQEELAASKDSIVLKVTGLNTGVFYLITDSINYNKPKRIEFEKNTEGTFKAKNSFFISSPKTETFKATVNDIPLKFEGTTVSKVKITRNGIVK